MEQNGAQPQDKTRLADYAELLISYKLEKEDAEARLKESNQKIRDVEAMIHQKMQEEEVEKFAYAGKLFYPRVESHPSAPEATRDEFFSWLEEKGEDGIIKRTVHPQTLKSWWNQNSERYGEELAGKEFFKVHEEIRIGMRAAK